MSETPNIAFVLRSYLSRMGHRAQPVQITEQQCEQLAKADLLHVDSLGITRFDGQELAIAGDTAFQRDLRSCARVIERINRT